MHGLVERARETAADIVAHHLLREQALTDALTKLGNRRKLAADLEERMQTASASNPLVLILFDLDSSRPTTTPPTFASDSIGVRRRTSPLQLLAHGTPASLARVLRAAQRPAELPDVVTAAAGAL